jgi:hypothetical protein
MIFSATNRVAGSSAIFQMQRNESSGHILDGLRVKCLTSKEWSDRHDVLLVTAGEALKNTNFQHTALFKTERFCLYLPVSPRLIWGLSCRITFSIRALDLHAGVARAIEIRAEARNAAYSPTLPKSDAMN